MMDRVQLMRTAKAARNLNAKFDIDRRTQRALLGENVDRFTIYEDFWRTLDQRGINPDDHGIYLYATLLREEIEPFLLKHERELIATYRMTPEDATVLRALLVAATWIKIAHRLSERATR